MPHRVNKKGDIGTAKSHSDSYDAHNIYLTEEGWVYRHYKTSDKTMWWDEILVAGQVKPGMVIHGVTNSNVSETNPVKLGLETNSGAKWEDGAGNPDFRYSDHVNGDAVLNKIVVTDSEKTHVDGDLYKLQDAVKATDGTPPGTPPGWTGPSDPSMDGEKPPFVGDDYEACNEYNITVTPLPAPGRDTEPRSVVVGEPDGTCDKTSTPPTPPADVPGCTDSTADNYNPAATVDDGSCTYTTDATPPTINGSIPITPNDNDNTFTFTVNFTEAADNTTTWETEVVAAGLYASTPASTLTTTPNSVTVVMDQPDRGIYNYSVQVVKLNATTTHSDGGTPATSTVIIPNISRVLPTCSASFKLTNTDGTNDGATPDGSPASNTIRTIEAIYDNDCTQDMRNPNLVVTETASGNVFNDGDWDAVNGTYTLNAPDANNGWDNGTWEDLTLTFTANYYESDLDGDTVLTKVDFIDLNASSYALPDAVAVDGYYPLYTSEADANAASSVGTSHSHMLGSQTYYMPDGLTMGTTMWHGTYGSSSGGGSGY